MVSASAEGGIRFGQYILLRRIARGGMAEVFLAQQKGLEGFDRRVAVKRILPHLADAPDFLRMFLTEARLAAQLTHPNVVHIYDFGKHDGDYFIAMEFVDGVHTGQLFKHIEKERLPPTMVARIGADAATALHYAHELRNANGQPLGLVHRDVSPANIMVSFDGVVKLCDFGIAKAAALGDQLTNPGQVKGKYAYMSPEQTIAAPLDGRSDVFSLAIVMWELLTGKTIVGRGDAVEAMRAIRDGKLPPIAQAAPHTPPALAKALTWAMQTRREIRATAMDFAQALEAFIKSSPELATPMQLGAWVRQRFAREGTGQHAAIPGVSVGTRVVGGTLATPGTAAFQGTIASPGTAVGTVTPQPENATRPPKGSKRDLGDTGSEKSTVPKSGPRMAQRSLPANPEPPNRMSTRELSEADLLDSAETVSIDQSREHAAANDATMIEPGARAMHAAIQRGETLVGSDTIEETVERSGAFRVPVAGGAAVVPTRIVEPPRVLRRRTPAPMATETTIGPVRRRRIPRRVIAVAGLLGIAIVSFLIALAARSPGRTAPRDAGVAIGGPADAARGITVDASVAVIAADATAPAGDARTPTVPVDAPGELTVLEVRTKPAGGTIRVGGESRADPAKFALLPGAYTIVAQLDGYQDEKRAVELTRGTDLVQEIAFTRKVSTSRPAPAVGKLTVRTTPYSDVFHNGKRLGETPFADLELAVGSYTLVFRNPTRGTVTRKVTIAAGKTTKLSFTLP